MWGLLKAHDLMVSCKILNLHEIPIMSSDLVSKPWRKCKHSVTLDRYEVHLFYSIRLKYH